MRKRSAGVIDGGGTPGCCGGGGVAGGGGGAPEGGGGGGGGGVVVMGAHPTHGATMTRAPRCRAACLRRVDRCRVQRFGRALVGQAATDRGHGSADDGTGRRGPVHAARGGRARDDRGPCSPRRRRHAHVPP